MFVSTVCEENAEFPVVAKVIENKSTVKLSAVTRGVGVGLALEDAFGVPAIESPRCVGGSATCTTPVVVALQISVAAKVLGDDVVDVVFDIDDGLDLRPGARVAGSHADHLIVGSVLLGGRASGVAAEDFVVLVAVMGGVVIVFKSLV